MFGRRGGICRHVAAICAVSAQVAALSPSHRTNKRDHPLISWDTSVWKETPYRLTRPMLRRSRLNYGDPSRMEPLLRMLMQGQCIKVAALGGSITEGNCHRGCRLGHLPREDVYPSQFRLWLNHAFPCKDPKGHSVHNFGRGGCGSDFWADEISGWKQDEHHFLWQADLVLFESSVNDLSNKGLERNWIPGQGLPRFARIQVYTELVLRQLQQAPKKPALIWGEFSWRSAGDQWKTEGGHQDASLAHLPVLQHYGVDHVGLVEAFLPLKLSRRKWADQNYFVDPMRHPTPLGHRMCAQLLGEVLLSWQEVLGQDDETERRFWFEPEVGGDAEVVPARFAPRDIAERYDTGSARRLKLFREKDTQRFIDSGSGFSTGQDVKGKPGLLAYSVNSSIELTVPFKRPARSAGRSIMVNVGLLKSYEHMGVVNVTLGVDAQGPNQKCARPSSPAKDPTRASLDCLWNKNISVYVGETLMVDADNLRQGCLRVHFQVVPAEAARAENKVKLIDLTVIA